MKKKPHGILFHHFHDEKKHPKEQGSISSNTFRKIIIYLKKNFNILSALQWYEKARDNKLEQNDICITFDDNLLCQYEIALPILEDFNIKAFWFIYSSPLIGIQEKLEVYRYFRHTQFSSINEFYKSFNELLLSTDIKEEFEEKIKFLDIKTYQSAFPFYTKEDKIFRYTRDEILGKNRYNKLMDEMINRSNMNIKNVSKNLWNSPSNIKDLYKKNHIIGLHSHSHPTDLKSMSYSEQLNEYKTNKQILTSIINSKIFAMSHPCNLYNEDTLKILQDMNVNLGFRASMESGYSSSLEYPRLDHALLLKKIQ